MEEEKKQKKELSVEELIQRAESSDSSEKYAIAANYYFVLLSRHLNTISKDKALYNKILYKFIFDTIMINAKSQKERFLNFLYQNDKLGVANYKLIFEKFFNYQIIFLDELKEIIKMLPSTHKNINLEKALFEHNLYSLSRVFTNISFNSLERFLNMKIDSILNYCISAINEGTINCKIDEDSKYILFLQEPSVSTNFDEQIKNFCLKTKALAEYIKTH